MIIKCRACGAIYEYDAIYCNNCGDKLIEFEPIKTECSDPCCNPDSAEASELSKNPVITAKADIVNSDTVSTAENQTVTSKTAGAVHSYVPPEKTARQVEKNADSAVLLQSQTNNDELLSPKKINKKAILIAVLAVFVLIAGVAVPVLISKNKENAASAYEIKTVEITDNITYTGNIKHPELTVESGSGKTLEEGKDYTVTYCCAYGCKKPGTHTLTVNGIREYSGTVKKTFEIEKQKVNASRITLSESSYKYTGNTKKPTVTVKNYYDEEMTNGKSYTVSYCCSGGCRRSGTHTVTVTGKGYYTGTATKTFKIERQALSPARVKLSETSYKYTGISKKPTVTVTCYDGDKITNGKSYTVTYCCADGCKRSGTHTVTVKGKGDYSGTVEKTFKIEKQALSPARVTLSAESFEYTGKTVKPTVTVKNYSDEEMTNGKSYTVSYCCSGGCKKTGTHTVTVTGKGDYSGTVEKTFKIK